MKTEHTPGPWKYIERTETIVSEHEDWQNSIVCKIATGEDYHQEKANAHLIAAAPEMLAALNAILGVNDYCDSQGWLSHEFKQALVTAKTAVNKSTGLTKQPPYANS